MEKRSFLASFPTRRCQLYPAFTLSSWTREMFFYNFLKHSLIQCGTGIKSLGIVAAGRAGRGIQGREISGQQMVRLS